MKKLVVLFFVLVMARAGLAETHNYYVPYYTSMPGYSTGIGVRNCSGVTPANVTVKVYNTSGSLIKTEPVKALAANGQTAFYAGTGFGQEGWLLISGDQPLAGLSFSFREVDPHVMFDVPFTSDLSSDILIPHVGQDPSWDTVVMACNPNNVATTLTIRFVKADGTKLTPFTRTVPAFGSGKYMLSEFTGGTPYVTGSVEIQSTKNITAFALFNDLKTGGFYYAGINASKTASNSYKNIAGIYEGTRQRYYLYPNDPLYWLNPCDNCPFSNISTTITIQIYGQNSIDMEEDCFLCGKVRYEGTYAIANETWTASGTFQTSDFDIGTWRAEEMKMISDSGIYMKLYHKMSNRECQYGIEFSGFIDDK